MEPCNSDAVIVQNAVLNSSTAFMGALQTMVVAACALVDPAQWPRDRTEEILSTPAFDFIVVGSGTAGSVVAGRLSENPDWNVLLVEAGGNPSLDSEILGVSMRLFKTGYDWRYNTVPQRNGCQSMVNRQCYWPQGKMLGGTGSFNNMVYFRGNPADYDGWRDLGNKGWSYEEVLPYFKKTERLNDTQIPKSIREKYHNERGPLFVEKHQGHRVFSDELLQAFNELNIQTEEDLSGTRTTGALKTLALVHRGRRRSTADAFLLPERENLFILRNTLVSKIVLNRKVAVGVEMIYDNKTYIIKAKKEVIVSAGAGGSPKLLMLSGIGPKQDLEALNLDVVQDLQVGRNLQEPPQVHNIILLSNMEPVDVSSFPQAVAEYLAKHTGALASVGPHEVHAFVNSLNLSDSIPNMEYTMAPVPWKALKLENDYALYNFNNESLKFLGDLNENYTLLDIFTTLLHPKSRGTIKLRSKDPKDDPVVDPNYYSDPNDLDIMATGMKLVADYADTNVLRKYDAKLANLPLEGCKNTKFKSTEYYKCYAKHFQTSSHHPVGTVKMGPSEDQSAVVSPELKVHGIENLRVIDASVMPIITRGNINTPIIMIAEKGSDMIKSDHKVSASSGINIG